LNYTSGQWDGWTPFETINDVSDLKKSEKTLMKREKPGWIVSTLDSCLWTFGGEFWDKANRLLKIAQFCAGGGKTQQCPICGGDRHRFARALRAFQKSGACPGDGLRGILYSIGCRWNCPLLWNRHGNSPLRISSCYHRHYLSLAVAGSPGKTLARPRGSFDSLPS